MKLTKYKLGEILDVTRGASLSGEFYATEGEYIRLTCGNFDYKDNCFKENKSKDNLYYVGDFKSEFLMEEGDIITPLTEQAIGLLGTTAIIPESGKYIQSQDVAKIICKEDLLDKDFTFYLISSALVKQQLSAGAQQTKIRHTSPDKIKNCAVWIPELSEQKRIGKLLRSIDRKIALNRAINQNLEAMANLLYDYWFVQFDFPNEEGKPYKSSGGEMVWNEKLKREIPADWEVLPLFDAVSVQYGFPFATEQFTEKETNVPVVRIRDILEGTTSAYSLEKADEKYHLNKNDVLVGMDGNFHMNFWHDNIAYLNQRCVRLRAHSDSTISSIQILHSIKPYIKAKEQNAKGSTVGHLSDKDLKGLHLIKPLKTRAFNPRKTLDGLLALVIENKKQILSLTKQRDELLPLLINGQITIE
ncbi:restriction endonuclease subunit S [Bacteroides fragilis]|uniref:restriction endonuclease subunit S n=2 Tax=Bacteroides fragilis TaxID=817 RepID=UPI0025743A71|nr:restriction endonuclease subunit S [Bacteroides fragilis]MCE8584008.1 restriction endonuclease subunit S [Bacteroides fragilis]MCE8667966.1 restriction endonuclease subunit S [Bacteroides fragilis]WJE92524.1 restriction endonuclease subunit S [Bacteroides fragilis]